MPGWLTHQGWVHPRHLTFLQAQKKLHLAAFFQINLLAIKQ
ncbi:hypothetical protein GAGA_4513 [Paraglaciecola agarilytica NO2]|uniref:Uncharacterized protein n=1 Tax=Paraglaciecola agarilytica NO2 TaxID=1125747 RepID=A0ABQ0IDI1_9ALTE|nr:hypothetical protein GAGA_4513 [Paraglaciecola agarilytica NO2]